MTICKPCKAAATRRGAAKWITFDTMTEQCLIDEGTGECATFPNAAQALAEGRNAGIELPGVRRL